jgi:hypothetical protein
MAFVRCRKKAPVNESKGGSTNTVLYKDYAPDGAEFMKTVEPSEFNLKEDCTFFCDIEMLDTSTMQLLISVGREIESKDGEAYPRSILHFMYAGNGSMSIYMSARYSGGTARRSTVSCSAKGNRIKIAFNSNGIVVNGFATATINFYSEYFQRLYGDLSRSIEVGSKYSTHSTQMYHEVSFIKQHMTIAEMQELTKV